MRRLLAAVVLACTFAVSSALAAKRPTNIYDEIWKSIALYEINAVGHCTATTVGFDPPTYITAAHCVGDEIPLGRIDNRPVVVVHASKELVVLRVANGKARPVFMLGSRPAYGDAIRQFGFGGGGFRIPFFFPGNVLVDNTIPYPGATNPMMVFNSNGIGGMSGGPILNESGQLVSIVLCGGHYGEQDAYFGCGATYDELQDVYRAATARNAN